jgi:hypothetical protein
MVFPFLEWWITYTHFREGTPFFKYGGGSAALCFRDSFEFELSGFTGGDEFKVINPRPGDRQ